MKSRIALVGAVLLGAAVGIGGYHFVVVSRAKQAVAPTPANFATQSEVAEVRKHLAAIESRLAKVEARPGFEQALNDPAMRERLAAAVAEARGPGAMAPRTPVPMPGPEVWRENMASRYRADYAKLLDEARKQLKLDDAAWKEVKPIFDRQFAPVDAALKEIVAGKGNSPPKVNELVAPGLPGTLEALRKAVPPEGWQAFDAWRKADEEVPPWLAGRGDYFLEGEDFKGYTFRRNVQTQWGNLRFASNSLFEKLGLDAEKKSKVEAILKAHVAKVFEAAKDDPRFSLFSEAGRTRAKAVTAETEAELAKVLSQEQLKSFREWKSAPGSMGAIYFGEMPRPPAPLAPAPAAPAPQPGIPGAGPERF